MKRLLALIVSVFTFTAHVMAAEEIIAPTTAPAAAAVAPAAGGTQPVTLEEPATAANPAVENANSAPAAMEKAMNTSNTKAETKKTKKHTSKKTSKHHASSKKKSKQHASKKTNAPAKM